MDTTRVRANIESICPILFDRYSGLNDANDVEAQKNAIHKLYLNEMGEVCIPADNIKASLREAGREIGKKMESRKREQAMRAGLFFTSALYSLGVKEPDEIFPKIVTRKGTGNKVTRVVTFRPMIRKWKIEFEAMLFVLTPDFIKQTIELAGFKYGLCGHRPEYGRFILVSFGIL